MSRQLILTGAGASFDLQNVAPKSPPLGNGLFTELVTRGDCPAWRSLTPNLKEGFLGPNGFEHGFLRVREVDDRLTTGLLREMGAFFLQFHPTGRTKYDFLVELTQRSRLTTTFATLNYDLLLDEAMLRHFGRVQYVGIEPATVLRLHGGPNFWPDLGTNVIKGASFSGNGRGNFEGPVKALLRQDAVSESRLARETGLAPAMALFAPGKDRLFCGEFIRQLQVTFAAELAAAEKVFVIGVAYAPHDQHVWGPLVGAPGSLTIVDPYLDQFGPFIEERTSKGNRTAVVEGKFREFFSGNFIL